MAFPATELQILIGDAREQLSRLDTESVQCVVTSPPYWGLRDYGIDGQLGLEKTPVEYVEKLVAVFREVRRVLADDGTLWINLGDSYSRDPAKGGSGPNSKHDTLSDYGAARRRMSETKGSSDGAVGRGDRAAVRIGAPGLKPKDLVGVPWRVAFALQADGWYLRSDIIWSKPNQMPESVTDRPTKAHEYIFLLTKSSRYYYDADSIRQNVVETTSSDSRIGTARDRNYDTAETSYGKGTSASRRLAGNCFGTAEGRNRRTVWAVATQPCAEAHFATYPPKLIEPCILAGSRVGDRVLDPFAGAGTTGLVAARLKRNFLGIEINAEYAAIAEKRIREDAPLLNRVEVVS